jgi:hypothetical protein
MKRAFYIIITCLTLFSINTSAQKITYSEPDKDDGRQLNFEIIGKIGSNVLIYKNYRDDHYIATYDQQMVMTQKEKLEKMPDKMINADFINYPDHAYMIYQYQRKSIVYCMGLKIGADGKAVGEPVQMDTTHINFWASNKLYNVLVSEDKQKIGVFKLNTKNEKNHVVTTVVFSKDLDSLAKHRIAIPMPDRYDYLTEFTIDNDGDRAFLKASSSSQNDNITKLKLLIKSLNAESVSENNIELKNIYLDDIRMKVDNANGKYLITSFYSKTKRGNIDGVYSYLWNKKIGSNVAANGIVFNDELRSDAKGDNNTKTAFNDYFLRNIVMRQDGGYIVTAESIYSSSRGGNPYSRWDYVTGSPYAGEFVPVGVNPYNYPWWRTRGFSQTTRYYADNVLVLSFNNAGDLEWSNVVRKSQYDDNNDMFLGYSMNNTGNELHFLYNLQEKRTLILSDQSIEPGGQLTRKPTLKNLDKGYDFMPRYGKQIGSKTIIFPCQYRSYICFAKVELN